MSKLPGVYITEQSGATATPSEFGSSLGVVGNFYFGEPNKVIELNSILDFESKLGGLNASYPDSIALYGAMLQKPRKVKAVRIVGTGASKASVTLTDGQTTPTDLVTITAKYEGAFGNDISVSIDKGTATITFGSISEKYVFTTAQSLVDAINASSEIVDASFVAEGTIEDGTSALTGGADGTITDTDYIGAYDSSTDTRTGLYVLDTEDDVDILWMGGGQSSTKRTALLTNASEYDRIAVLPLTSGSNLQTAITDGKTIDNYRAFVAFPNVVIDTKLGDETVDASAIVAGVLGAIPVQNSPAGQPLSGVKDVARGLTKSEMESLVDAGINPIALSAGAYRLKTGWTATSNTDWQQVGIRRVFDYANRVANTMLEQFVSQPNTPTLWSQVRSVLTSLGHEMVGAGMIQDFSVQCDKNLNPPDVQAQKKLRASFSILPIYAADYIEITLIKSLSAFNHASTK